MKTALAELAYRLGTWLLTYAARNGVGRVTVTKTKSDGTHTTLQVGTVHDDEPAEQRLTHRVVFFDEDTNNTLATVTVFTVLENDGTTCDAIQIAATARKCLTNASARVLDPDTGNEVAAYGADEIEEWWA